MVEHHNTRVWTAYQPLLQFLWLIPMGRLYIEGRLHFEGLAVVDTVVVAFVADFPFAFLALAAAADVLGCA